jgi:Fe-S oxidoreductase
VLEHAGYQVRLPDRVLCCGRPLYDFGMLPLARRLLGQVLEELRPAVRAGLPVVGLEPSCLSVFRDELTNLFPEDQDARRLAERTFTLAELLVGQTFGYRPPRLPGRALLHGHCHQRAIVGMDADLALLGRMGLEAELVDAGCCGMAGPFGFEAGHYRTSQAMGERVLLPRVRAADAGTLVVADGFSCATMVAQGAGRRPLHLAEVVQLGLRGGQAPPEPASARRSRPRRGRAVAVGAGAAALVAAGGLVRRHVVRRALSPAAADPSGPSRDTPSTPP